MTSLRLVRAEMRKLTTTKMPWGFLAVLAVISATTAAAVVWGADADGSKAFIATREDQRSLLAFGANAMVLPAGEYLAALSMICTNACSIKTAST